MRTQQLPRWLLWLWPAMHAGFVLLMTVFLVTLPDTLHQIGAALGLVLNVAAFGMSVYLVLALQDRRRSRAR